MFSTVDEAFESKLRVNVRTGCYEWTGRQHKYGYGALSRGSRTNGTLVKWLAHRYAWYLEHGEDLRYREDVKLVHNCGNRLCCNPEHLTLVDSHDIKAQLVNAGIQNFRYFTDEEVESLRRSKLTNQALADFYGVHQSTISRLITGDCQTRNGRRFAMPINKT